LSKEPGAGNFVRYYILLCLKPAVLLAQQPLVSKQPQFGYPRKCNFQHWSQSMEFSFPAVRTLHLAAQGLCTPPAAPATKTAVLATIRQMGVLQIDTIHVVARSPYFVLWSRLGDYEPRWLDELLAEGQLFEYWSHAACFLPIEDYALYRRSMIEQSPRSRAWLAANPAAVDRVLALLHAQPTVRAADFPRTDGRAGQWWDRKPEKNALECLFNIGEIMIARRENFQRIYTLRQHRLPDWDDSALPTPEAILQTLVAKSIQALGVTPLRWIADYFRLPKRVIPAAVAALVQEGLILRVEVEGWPEPAYLHRANLLLAEQVLAGAVWPTRTTLLSPFDPVVWDRARAVELFGFSYRIESYTRAAERRHGYFTLPILHEGQLIGRLDPKAHRKAGIFEVKALHLEEGVAATPHLVDQLAGALIACARWHGTPQVQIAATDPVPLGPALEQAICKAAG
jgi:uncharacterized protein